MAESCHCAGRVVHYPHCPLSARPVLPGDPFVIKKRIARANRLGFARYYVLKQWLWPADSQPFKEALIERGWIWRRRGNCAACEYIIKEGREPLPADIGISTEPIPSEDLERAARYVRNQCWVDDG